MLDRDDQEVVCGLLTIPPAEHEEVLLNVHHRLAVLVRKGIGVELLRDVPRHVIRVQTAHCVGPGLLVPLLP